MRVLRAIIGVCILASVVMAGGLAFANKGHYHFKGNCQHAACHCTEFWAKAGTSICYYCDHMDYMHKR